MLIFSEKMVIYEATIGKCIFKKKIVGNIKSLCLIKHKTDECITNRFQKFVEFFELFLKIVSKTLIQLCIVAGRTCYNNRPDW